MLTGGEIKVIGRRERVKADLADGGKDKTAGDGEGGRERDRD